MELFTRWKESLQLCTLQNIRAMLALSAKTAVDVIKILSTAWVIMPAVLFVVLARFVGDAELFFKSLYVVSVVLSFFAFIAARPSKETKDWRYFKKNILRSLWFFVLFIAVFIGGSVLYRIIFEVFASLSSTLAIIIALVSLFFYYGLLTMLLAPSYSCAILFYLDRQQDGMLKALKRGIVMVWYNMPLFVVYAVLMLFVWLLGLVLVVFVTSFFVTFYPVSVIEGAIGQIVGTKSYIWFMLTYNKLNTGGVAFFMFVFLLELMKGLFSTSVAVNLYANRVREQYSLYFEKEQKSL